MTEKKVVYTAEVLEFSKRYTLHELCKLSRLTEATVTDFIDYEVIIPDGPSGQDFTHRQLNRLMRASRLQRDLEINTPGVALVIELLELNQSLKSRLIKLQQHASGEPEC